MLELREIVPRGDLLGASLILPTPLGYLFGGKPPRLEAGGLVIRVTGIGGRVEPGEAFAECAAREALEEIGCGVEILPCRRTLLVRGPNGSSLEKVETAPYAVVRRRAGAPPGEPWGGDPSLPWLTVVVYLARLRGEPRPVEERLPFLFYLGARGLEALSRGDVPLADLLLAGARVDPLAGVDPPAGSVARLTDSPEALLMAIYE